MLGTSLTYRADWNALLHRCDVLNRGIPGDVTEGMLYRLPPLLADSSLRICFIEGGGNDLPQGLPLPRILANLHQLADTFIHRGVHAVLITTPYCSPVQANYRWINYRIAFLNAGLRYWAPKWGVPLLDLNMLLSGTAESLDPGFANEGDGVHLTAPAFALWSQAVNQMLSRMDI
jgi:alpha-glucosidase